MLLVIRLQRVPALVLPVHCVAVALGTDETGSILSCWVFSTGLSVLAVGFGLQTEQAVKPRSLASSKVISFLEFLR